jgi:hypothetical protein
MRRARGVLAAAVAIVVLSAGAAPGASASVGGTTAAVDGKTLTLTVNIDMVVDDPADPENVDGSQFLETEIAKFWNDAFGQLDTDCLSFVLVVDIGLVRPTAVSMVRGGERRPVGEGLPAPEGIVEQLGGSRDWVMTLAPVPDGTALVTTPGRHVVYVVEGGVAPSTTYDPYDGDGHAPPGEDYGSPLEHELWSVWEDDLGELGFVHEFGHLLGLGDDYDDDGEPLPGREGTVMGGPGGGSVVDRNLLDRLAELARGAGEDVPSCAEWAGKAPRMRSEVIYSGGPYRCEDAWAFDFTFTEAADGTVNGQGTAELVQDWICEPTFPGSQSPSQRFAYGVEGERDGDAFNLRFMSPTATVGVGMAAMWNPESPQAKLRIPISGSEGSVEASWAWSFTNPDGTLVRYFTDGSVEIDCAGCPPGSG